MSICLAQDTLSPSLQLLLFTVCLVVAVVLAAAIGVYRARSVVGPDRFPPDLALWRLALAGVIAATIWLGLQVAYVAVKAAAVMRTHPGEHFDVERHLNANDYAVLATVPFIVGFLIMLALDRSLDRRTLDSIGLGARHFLGGVLRGLLGILITFPLIICSSLIVEQLYRAVHFDHPSAHELLAEMKQTNQPLVRAALILGAAVLAPLFEEYLFRGHIQTFLVSIFTMSQRRPHHAFEVIVTPQPETLDPSAPNTPSLDYQTPPPPTDRRSTRAVWMGILLTSLLFALIHPLWTAPLIFVLSICLGYAYERTGNLWVPITIHALFNTISTIEYLYFF